MSEIKKLIDRLCPDGVEWEKLVDNVDVLYGYPFDSRLFCEDETFMPLIRIRDVKPAKASTYYSGEVIEEYRITKGDILVGMDGNFNLEKWNDVDGLLNQRVCKLSSKNEDKILNGFIYHYLKPVFKSIEGELNSGTVIHLSAKRINKIEIPIPPMEVQCKIVEILDNFTELEAELEIKLEAELEARRKQYEYYRNQLLTFDKVGGGVRFDIKWMKMKDVCSLQRGKVYSKKYISENKGSYPVYSSQTANNGVLGKINSYDYDGTYLTWTTDGAYAGTIFYRGGKFNITNVCGLISISQDFLDLRFLYYWLSLTAKKYVYQGMGNPKLMLNQVEMIDIPILPICEQKRIANILDRFEALTTDLQSGLPAEIEARRKQYEYYREQLLTFKRKTA